MERNSLIHSAMGNCACFLRTSAKDFGRKEVLSRDYVAREILLLIRYIWYYCMHQIRQKLFCFDPFYRLMRGKALAKWKTLLKVEIEIIFFWKPTIFITEMGSKKCQHKIESDKKVQFLKIVWLMLYTFCSFIIFLVTKIYWYFWAFMCFEHSVILQPFVTSF